MEKPITLCDRCKMAVSCLLNYDGVPCRKNRTVEPTKADRLRAMSDEDLDHFLWMRQFDDSMFPMCNTKMNTVTAWLEWLRSEDSVNED